MIVCRCVVFTIGRDRLLESFSDSPQSSRAKNNRLPWPIGSTFMVDVAVPVAADAPEGPMDLLVGIYPDGAPGDRLAAVDDVGSAISQNALRLPAALTVLPGAGAGQEGGSR